MHTKDDYSGVNEESPQTETSEEQGTSTQERKEDITFFLHTRKRAWGINEDNIETLTYKRRRGCAFSRDDRKEEESRKKR